MTLHDPINSPRHYIGDSLEVIDVIEDWGLGFHLANPLKYILRAPLKGGLQDLGKCKWYASRAERDNVIDYIARENAPFSIGVLQVQVDFKVPHGALRVAIDSIHRAALCRHREPRREALHAIIDNVNLFLATPPVAGSRQTRVAAGFPDGSRHAQTEKSS